MPGQSIDKQKQKNEIGIQILSQHFAAHHVKANAVQLAASSETGIHHQRQKHSQQRRKKKGYKNIYDMLATLARGLITEEEDKNEAFCFGCCCNADKDNTQATHSWLAK